MIDYNKKIGGIKQWQLAVLVVVSVLVAIGAILAFIFLFKHKTNHKIISPANNPFAPSGTNGSPTNTNGKSSKVFNDPQFIDGPFEGYGQMLANHEYGYIACGSRTQLQMYKTNEVGVIEQQNLITPLTDFAETGYTHIVDVHFAPSIGVELNEIYYLFVSLGTTVVGTIKNKTYYCAGKLVIYYFDSGASNPSWLKSSTVIKHPAVPWHPVETISSTGVSYPAIPYKATFGDTFKIIKNSRSNIPSQDLYIRGTDYSETNPGGVIFWYIIENNDHSPIISPNIRINDAKLTLLKSQKGYVPIVKTVDDYMLGFGVSFDVGTLANNQNMLIVANASREDNGELSKEQPASPNGYVQGYTLNTKDNLGWRQEESGTGTNVFNYRYLPISYNGSASYGPNYGISCKILQQFIIVSGFPTSTSFLNKSILYVYNWEPAPFKLTLGTNPYSKVVPKTLIDNALYNQEMPILPVETNVIWGGFDETSLTNTFTMFNPQGNPSTPYADWKSISSYGDAYNSGGTIGPVNGFAQKLGTWSSTDALSIFLVFTDPGYGTNGRLIIMHKHPLL